MPTSSSRRDFNKRLCVRLKQAREDAGETQETMAGKLAELGITLQAYKKYENRSPVPAYLIPPICRILKITAWWLLTGQQVQNVDFRERAANRA